MNILKRNKRKKRTWYEVWFKQTSPRPSTLLNNNGFELRALAASLEWANDLICKTSDQLLVIYGYKYYKNKELYAFIRKVKE